MARTVFFLMFLPPPRSALFPYTTLFRSRRPGATADHGMSPARARRPAGSREGRGRADRVRGLLGLMREDRKSTRLNSSHVSISYAVFCLKKKKQRRTPANEYVSLSVSFN